MKKLVFILLVLIPIISFSQGKKAIKNNNISSKTITTTYTNKEGKTTTYKDNYEEYDKKGNTILKINYNKDGSVKKRTTFKYDSFNNLTEEIVEEGNPVKKTSYSYKYNSDGKKTSEIVKNEEGKTIKRITYSYDSKKLRTEKQEFDKDNKLKSRSITTYEYNK